MHEWRFNISPDSMGKMLRIQVKIMRKLSSGISIEFSWQLLYNMKKYENDVLKCHL